MTSNSKFKTKNSRFLNQRGVALIVVLWIFIFLSVVAFDFTVSVREEGLAAHRYSEEAGGYYLAVAGFQRALYELLPQPAGPGRSAVLQWRDVACGEWGERPFGDGFYSVRPIDEGGKVSLNRADENTLRRIFANLGLQEQARSILVDSILDWRDADDLHRLNGAEKDYYQSLSPSYAPKNGPFDAVEDLLWVRGMTPELFYGNGVAPGLKAIFSVDSPMDRINLGTAPAEVIHALLGVPLAESLSFVEMRCTVLGESTLADMLRRLGMTADQSALQRVVFANPTVITLEVSGYRAESVTQRGLKGVVRLLGGQRGYELLRWIDRETAPSRRPEG
jgi:type II secretory pathway component PulK